MKLSRGPAAAVYTSSTILLSAIGDAIVARLKISCAESAEDICRFSEDPIPRSLFGPTTFPSPYFLCRRRRHFAAILLVELRLLF